MLPIPLVTSRQKIIPILLLCGWRLVIWCRIYSCLHFVLPSVVVNPFLLVALYFWILLTFSLSMSICRSIFGWISILLVICSTSCFIVFFSLPFFLLGLSLFFSSSVHHLYSSSDCKLLPSATIHWNLSFQLAFPTLCELFVGLYLLLALIFCDIRWWQGCFGSSIWFSDTCWAY